MKRNVKRIRKTDDLVYFNFSQDEDDTYLTKQDQSCSGNEENSSLLANSLQIPKSLVNLNINSIPAETKINPTRNLNGNDWICTVGDGGIEKRKIIKAKRLLRNQNYKLNILNVESKINTPPITINSFKLTKTPKKSSSFKENSLSVNTLPSPISPSTENTNHQTSILTQHLQFNTSHEDLQPSTSGRVATNKRRTYELEDSIIDVSLLKSESEKDASRMNSLRSDSNQDSEVKTPNKTYSKVTVRKRWDKGNIYSPFSSPKSIINKKETKQFVSKIKIPNFAAIHQKALEKVESITEYKERKETRAKMLLSGQKPIIENTKIQERESRKQLRFASNTVERKKSSTYIPLPSTPLPKYKMTDNDKTPKAKTPFKNILHLPQHKTQIPIIRNPFDQKPKETNPFHQKPKKAMMSKKTEFKKCVTTKGRLETNAVDSRRCAIKGVRSNRRFELLMNMRKGL